MKLVRTSDGSTEPVTLTQANDQLRRDSSADDDYVNRLISAARNQFELDTDHIVTSSQSWTLYLDVFPEEEILIPKQPILSIASVKYYDTDGNLQTWGSSNYHTDIVSTKGRVLTTSSTDWPDTQTDRPNAVEVAFTAGYADATTVADDIRQAILLLVSHLYENRQEVVTGVSVTALPMGYERLIARHRMYGKIES